jgi:hypothetical protein
MNSGASLKKREESNLYRERSYQSLEKADLLIEKINRVIDDAIPLFSSDEIPRYRNSLLKTYGIDEEPTREHAKRGRPKKPIRLPHPDLDYVQVVKHRKKGRVTSIETSIIFGDKD